MNRWNRAVALALVGCLNFAGLVQTAQATTISTEAVAADAGVALRPAEDARNFLEQTLQREDVVSALQQRGVDMAQAHARVAALSDAEAQAMAQQIDAAPAGAGDVLGTIVFIFVLLLITDILGFTKVFPFTRSIR
jgi:hypothetical protein